MTSGLADLVRDVPDHPRPGIVFKDLTPLFADGVAFAALIDQLASSVEGWGADLVVGVEARGFVVGAPVARQLGIGFVPVRKPGKLPGSVLRREYDLEYGTDVLELHDDALAGHHRVAIVDDVLATGGTAAAVRDLVADSGATCVGAAFALELAFLGGRSKLGELPMTATMVVD